MSDPVVIALIGTIGTIPTALIGAWGVKTGRILAATHRQVANDHGTNLRDDLDQQTAMLASHGATLDRLEDLIRAEMSRTAALESGFLLVTARLGDGESRFAEAERHLRIVDERLDGLAARIRKGDHL